MTEREAAAFGEEDGKKVCGPVADALRHRELDSARIAARSGGQVLVGWTPAVQAAYVAAFEGVRQARDRAQIAEAIAEERGLLERHSRLYASPPPLFLLVEAIGEWRSTCATRTSERDARMWRGTDDERSVWALWPEASDELLELDFEAELLRKIDGKRPEVRPFLKERLALLRARLAQLECAK